MTLIQIKHCDDVILLDTKSRKWIGVNSDKQGVLIPFIDSLESTVCSACDQIWGPVYANEKSAIANGHIPGISEITLWDHVTWTLI